MSGEGRNLRTMVKGFKSRKSRCVARTKGMEERREEWWKGDLEMGAVAGQGTKFQLFLSFPFFSLCKCFLKLRTDVPSHVAPPHCLRSGNHSCDCHRWNTEIKRRLASPP